MNYDNFFAYLKETNQKITDFINQHDLKTYLKPADMYEGVMSYLQRPAKRLRPGVLLMACGCLGGEERVDLAVPAAAGVEMYHTWTLVHDDIIDNDSLRRGQPTVHEAMTIHAQQHMGLDEKQAQDYGRDIAILAGDFQQGWAVSLFLDCVSQMSIDPILILNIVKYLLSYVQGNLIYGEVLDVQYSLTNKDKFTLDEADIIKMLWLKTGVLYEFASLAGAMIGKNTPNINDEQVQAIKNFASNCGIAFQLQDDILGILADEAVLGKPVGSDIREGKMTVVAFESLKNATPIQKNTILSTLGNQDTNEDDIERIKTLFQELNGIDYTENLAKRYIEKALPFLDQIKNSTYKDLLLIWADFMINRKF